MDSENLTVSEGGFNPTASLGATLRTALLSPTTLGPASLAAICGALWSHDDDAERCRLALSAVAAIFYTRPDLIDMTLIDALFDRAAAGPIPDDVSANLRRLLGFLVTTPAAPYVWTRLSGFLRDERLDITTRGRLLPLVREFADWRQDLIGLDGVLALAESLPSPEQRAFLLDYGVERFVFCAPEAFTGARLARIATLFGHAPRYRYALRFLAARRSLAPEVSRFLAQQLAGCFPLQEEAAAILVDRPVRMLVVMNISTRPGRRDRAPCPIVAGTARRESAAHDHAARAAVLPLRQPAGDNRSHQG